MSTSSLGGPNSDFSDSSSHFSSPKESSTAVRSTLSGSVPPTMCETLFNPCLFFAFLHFLETRSASENVLFLKHCTTFRMFDRPLVEQWPFLAKLIWTYLTDSAPSPVNVSAEVRKQLLPILWDARGPMMIKKDILKDATQEVRLLLEPLHKEWIATNSWSKIKFFHAPVPTVQTALDKATLRDRLETFVKTRATKGEVQKFAQEDKELFDFLCEVHDVLAHMPRTKKEKEKIARRYLRANKEKIAACDALKGITIPKSALKRKKKAKKNTESTTGDDSGRRSAYRDAASDEGYNNSDSEDELDGMTALDVLELVSDTLHEEMNESQCYELFLTEQNWDSDELMYHSLTRSRDANGYIQYPTLAAVLSSPTLGPSIMGTMRGTPRFDQMNFLIESFSFYCQFPQKNHLTAETKKECIMKARKLFEAYFETNSIGIPKSLNAEVARDIHSLKFRLTKDTFRRSAAWLYREVSNSWIREVLSLFLWVDQDYSNESETSMQMLEYFNNSVLDEKCPSKLLPMPDDVLINPKLLQSFVSFLPDTENIKSCVSFIMTVKELRDTPRENKEVEKKLTDMMLVYLKDVLKEIPELTEVEEDVRKHVEDTTVPFNKNAVAWVSLLVAKYLFELYYLRWIAAKKHEIAKILWTPSKMMLFAGAEAITGTSSIPSVGNVSTVKEVHADTSSTAITKPRWSFASIGKKIRRQSARVRSGSASDLEISEPIFSSASPSPSPSPRGKKQEFEKDFGITTRKNKDTFTVFAPTKNTVYTDPASPKSVPHSPVGSPRSQPPILEIPSFNDIFDSQVMRRMFFTSYLNDRLSKDEKEIWHQLEIFFGSFSDCMDMDLSTNQKAMKERALSILSLFGSKVPKTAELIDYLSKEDSIITARFFRPLENELYKCHYDGFRDYLLGFGWVKR